ncbi:MAG: TerB N-terminal domain-containing protein, partial [Bacteroidota bacterium]
MTADECWVSPGQLATVAGRTILRGMVYVGTGLPATVRWYGAEPALIDPMLPVRGYETVPIDSDLSYAELAPDERGEMLDWLADGASGPLGDEAYLALYFAGLERRFFFDDGTTEADRDAIYDEVRRLLVEYPHVRSFPYYARRFLEAAEIARRSAEPLYTQRPAITRQYSLGLAGQVALGQAVADDQPIPADWILLWAYQNDHAEWTRRTPAQRCMREMRQLFQLRYTERFGEGIQIGRTRGRLQVHYHASTGFFAVKINVGALPDVSKLRRPLNQIRPVFIQCTDELSAYSRFIGRHPEKRGTREAIGLLPDDLARAQIARMDDPFVRWVGEKVEEQAVATVPASELIERWTSDEDLVTKTGALRKRAAEGLVGFLDLLDVGMEPDVRRGRPALKRGQQAVLFELPDETLSELSPPTPHFQAAELTLRLAADMAGTTPSAKARAVLDHAIETWPEISPSEQRRLSAYLAWQLTTKPSARGLKPLIAKYLDPEGRRKAANLALRVALTEGQLQPAGIKQLEKLYRTLGLDPGTLYTDMHQLQLGADQPHLVWSAIPGTRGRTIPLAPSGSSRDLDTDLPALDLDMTLVQAKLADTAKASALLADVFAEEEDAEEHAIEDAGSEEPGTEEPEADTTRPDLLGLDGQHAALVRALVAQAEWPREAYEALAGELGLMAGGALEVIN